MEQKEFESKEIWYNNSEDFKDKKLIKVDFSSGVEPDTKFKYIQFGNSHINTETAITEISEEGDFMDSNDYIIKLIEKVEISNQQLKNDMIESEKRIAEDRKNMEMRVTEERRLSEERMEKKFIETMESIKALNNKIDSQVNIIEDKIDKRMDKLENKYDNLKWWILGVCLSTIIGIAAMVYSTISILPKK